MAEKLQRNSINSSPSGQGNSSFPEDIVMSEKNFYPKGEVLIFVHPFLSSSEMSRLVVPNSLWIGFYIAERDRFFKFQIEGQLT